MNLEEFSGSTVMGIDMGMICHVTVGRVFPNSDIRLLHIEQVHISNFRERYAELRRMWGPRIVVMDSQPYTETCLALQQTDQRLYGAVYVNSRKVELFQVADKEEKKDEGVQDLRQVNISRDKAFDALMDFLRLGRLTKRSC